VSEHWVIKLIELAAGVHSPYEGWYVKKFRPPSMLKTGHYSDDGILIATPHIVDAKQFDSPGDAMEEYRREAGTRTDGRPNRPLTAWTVEILPLGDMETAT
jgi:hypothetical protein